jgi:N-acetylglucosamine transport system permease protein
MATAVEKPAQPQARTPDGAPRFRQSSDRGMSTFAHVVLVFWSLLVLVPFGWALLASFKDTGEIFGDQWPPLPDQLLWSNFSKAWEYGVGDYLLNSVVVVTGSVVGTMLFGSMVAYVLARYEFILNRPLYYLFAAGMMFPVFLAIVPLFFVLKNIPWPEWLGGHGTEGGLISSYPGLILVYVAYSLPFTIFFMHAFFRTLPTSVAEAALVDGASHAGVFFRVMLPMAKPGLLGVGIFNVLGQWNQFVLPSFLSPEKPVLSQGIATLLASMRYRNEWGPLFAALAIAMIPVIIVYLIFYRQVQAGLTSATLK